MLRKALCFLTAACVPFLLFSGQEGTASGDHSKEAPVCGVDFAQKLLSLHWKHAGNHKLSRSGATIVLPKDYMILVGDDAQKEIELTEGFHGAGRDENVEAIISDTAIENRFLAQVFTLLVNAQLHS